MLTIYGIKSCDTCRKARKYFSENKIEFRFHDFRVDGLDLKMLQRWTMQIDWSALLNKQSLTWRRIPEVDRADMTQDRAFALLLENPTLIKRPVLETEASVEVGFSADRFRPMKNG
jgi:Spx/MgsR family transcriptional regulator